MKQTKRFLRRRLNALCNVLVRREQVAMLHTGRCGSTVIARMLEAHPKVSWGGEIFNRYMGGTDRGDPGRVHRVISGNRDLHCTPVYGFETKYLPQLHLSQPCINMPLEAYVGYLNGMGFRSFILLHRRNYLRRAVSAEIGRRTRQWHSTQGRSAPNRIHLDINRFQTGHQHEPLVSLFERMDEAYEQAKNVIKDTHWIEITYEEDVQSDPSVAFGRVADFLGIERRWDDVKLARTNPFSLEELISNFDEVRSTLQGTRYEWMLDA